MSALPRSFVFSQSSLKDWRECPRRFDLRYLQRLAYPAVEAEPALENEAQRQRGEAFHRLLYQALSGAAPNDIQLLAASLGLEEWWENWRLFAAKEGFFASPTWLLPEVSLSAPLAGFRLQAKFDLLMVREGQALIYDWKTSSHPPRPENLGSAIQTRVYRAVLTLAGKHLNAGRPFDPSQVQMRYWFAQFPQQPVRLAYSSAQFERDLQTLQRDLTQIAASSLFERTADEKRCAFCVYRSYCERGQSAAQGQPDEDALDLDWDTLPEQEL